jgi:sterol desaturase/sphingolipid hydroxylase (fatty acid hydroxylase superfamily)
VTIALWIVFGVLLLTHHTGTAGRVNRRSVADWILDLSNLMIQGLIIPWVAEILGPSLWGRWVAAGSWNLGLLSGFFIQFVLIDWVYYWNHRAMHRLWPLHRVHHSAKAMDVWVTSRNTLWTSFLLVYFWANTLFLHALSDTTGYRAGIALTAALDLWRHSSVQVNIPGLIQPKHHAWHHDAQGRVHFGANLSLWDRLHGTWQPESEPPKQVGIPVPFGLWRQLLWPFEASK